MKCTLIGIGAAIITAAGLRADDITTLRGEKFVGVTVSRVEPNGIVITKSDGIVKVLFTDLSPELRSKYGYDPEKAAQFSAAEQAAAAQFNASAQSAAAQQQTVAAAENQTEQDKKNARWIVGKVQRVQENGFLIQPPRDSDGKVSYVSDEDQLGVTNLAIERFNREKSSMPADFQGYLAKGGTFFGSVRGMRYIATNWIKSPNDYQTYFSLEKLFQTKNFLKDLAVLPPVESDQEVFVRAAGSLGVVDGDYVSLWIVPDEIARSEGGSTYRGYRLLGSK
jgi:hypothetical protein